MDGGWGGDERSRNECEFGITDVLEYLDPPADLRLQMMSFMGEICLAAVKTLRNGNLVSDYFIQVHPGTSRYIQV